MREAYRPLAIVAAFAVFVAGVEVALQGHDQEQPLSITQLVLDNSREIDGHLVEDTYRARLTHTGHADADFARVTARIAWPLAFATPGLVQIVDGDLAFGTVRSGETVESVDTVTIRRHRYQTLRLDQLRWVIDARPDLVLPDAWAGRWRFMMLTKNAATGTIVSAMEVTDDIGAGQPVGFSLLPQFAHCTWRGSDGALDATCWVRTRIGSCHVEGSAALTLDRAGDSLSGHTEWRADSSGDCGDAAGGGAETMEVTGVRESSEFEPARFSPGLLSTLVNDPAFSLFIASGPGALSGSPASDGECEHGEWRRFWRHRFHGESDCHKFRRGHQQRGRQS